MLTLTIAGEELWDDEAERFCYTDATILQLEHSLVSLSKWEAKFHKLFLTPEEKSDEEMLGYVDAMLLTPEISREVLETLTEEHVVAINEYINDPMTGTTFRDLPKANSQTSERISSELIYFWMSQYGIASEAQNWHLNRLFTLIKIHYAKSQKPKKMSPRNRAQEMKEENERRKALYNSRG